MKLIKKALHVMGLIFITLITVIVFLPKDQLFFLAERELQSQGVNLKYDFIEDSFFGVKIKNVVAYYMGSEVARMKMLDLCASGIESENIHFNGVAKNALGNSAEYINMNLLPQFLDAKGSFGVASGSFDVTSMSLKFKIAPSESLKRSGGLLLNTMKKEGGDYVYDWKI